MRRLAFCLLMLAAASVGAEDFSLVDLQGKTHSLAAYRGRWVVLNLWATWCAPCLAEMPELDAFAKARPEVAVIGLATDGQSPRRLKEFAARLGVGYPIVAGDEASLSRFGARVMPTTLVFNPAGERVLRREGSISRQALEDAVKGP